MSNKNLNVIIGLGKTGLSCVRYCLLKRLPFAVTDSRDNPPEIYALKEIASDVEVSFGQLSADLISRAERLIISPGVSLKEPVIERMIQNGVPFVGDIELFVQEIKVPIIAITGSNAKSTVTALVGKMAEKAGINVQVAGNIGTPVLDLQSQDEVDLYVLELSSFQLETTHSLKTQAAVVLNISEDHMDRYASMNEYIAAKMRIYNNCRTAVINRKTNYLKDFSIAINNNITFGLDAPLEEHYGLSKSNGNYYLACGSKRLLNINEMKLQGRHHVENALAALALGEAAGIDMQSMLQTLREFNGLPHRCEFICERKGVKWYNDSKGTNVGAVIAALDGLSDRNGKIILIAGGVGKGADFALLKKPIKNTARKVILIGEASKEISVVLNGVCEIEEVDSLKEAVKSAEKAALSGDKVILSPACASFDMFQNYEHRGNEFKRLVKLL